ncbi:hypothetical protein H5023_13485 [Pseudomonas aeruginosa]|uniref:hypothetical protein n=1 Tax=Pseudomonas aeruginosa TaxID=287 RepID=UPI00397D2030
MNTTEYEITNIGTPGFPKFEVRLNVADEQGVDLEHLSQTIGCAPSYQQAMTIQWEHEHGKGKQL